MLNASRQSFPVSAVICLLMAALFAARYRLAPYLVEAPFEGGMPLAAALVRFSVAFPWIAAACAGIVLVWTLLVVVQLTVKYTPAANRNYLPAQVFLVAATGLVISGEALAALISAWLFTLATRQAVFSFNKEYRFSEVFHAGFYLGLIPLLYAPAALIVPPAMIAALVIYRRSWREAIVCLVGLLLPLSGAGFIHWATGDGNDFIYRELWKCTMEHPTLQEPTPVAAAIPAALVFALALVAMFRVLGHKKSVRKTQYKFMQYISLTLLLILASASLPGTSTTPVALAAVPCALSVPYAFHGRSATASTVIYYLMAATVFAIDLAAVLGISAR